MCVCVFAISMFRFVQLLSWNVEISVYLVRRRGIHREYDRTFKIGPVYVLHSIEYTR